jgi:hypothetical protein
VKNSHASIVAACVRRNCRQVDRVRCGAGGIRSRFRTCPARKEETATFKRVRQARRHELWRVAQPFDPSVAVRIICWFPSDEEVVIALVGFD